MRERSGIKLYPRECKGRKCEHVFWVPRKSEQKWCSRLCEGFHDNILANEKFHKIVDKQINPKRKSK